MVDGTQKMLVMELMTQSLYDMLRKGSVNPELQWKIANDIVCGMYYLVSCQPPIYHRDLKSHNILLDSSLRAKITDFGLSKVKTESLSSLSRVGTPQWSAPEVLDSDSESVDYEKADVFSFGVVLWELVTGNIPWKGLRPDQVISAVAFKGKRLEISDNVDSAMKEIITQCWRQPQERKTFKDLLDIICTSSYCKVTHCT
jgi:sterile alpha motif and leucine zipper-containing kinase AZK